MDFLKELILTIANIVPIVMLIWTILASRKEQAINIITKSRISKYEVLQQEGGKFISSCKIISLLGKSEDNIKEMLKASGQVRSQLTHYFEGDQRLAEKMNDIITFITQTEDNVYSETHNKNIDSFIHLLDVYLATEWDRIRNEADVKKKRTKNTEKWANTFDSYYQSNFETRYRKLDKWE